MNFALKINYNEFIVFRYVENIKIQQNVIECIVLNEIYVFDS